MSQLGRGRGFESSGPCLCQGPCGSHVFAIPVGQPESGQPCRACGGPIPESRGRNRRYCSVECMPRRSQAAAAPCQGPPEVECRFCRGPLPDESGRPGVRRLIRRYCSQRCRNIAAGQRHGGDRPGRGAGRRFPRIRGAARLAVFDRDDWRCRLCGAPIDPALTFPHPGSGSIDHIDPDGPHDPANWQASHLACNVSKGRKIAPGASPRLRRRVAA